jgi:uncharacterized protein (TIGR02147 family)
MKSIFSYTNYREFLKDFYQDNKIDNPRFSHRHIAVKMGFDSGYFTKIIQGKRNISKKLISKFAVFLNLKVKETRFFEALVLYNQAESLSEKRQYLERLLSFKRTDTAVLDKHQYDLFDKWYYFAIREILAFYPFSGDYKELASLSEPQIRLKDAKKAIQVLEKAGLIVKKTSGIYERVEPVWTTGSDVRSIALVNLHRSMADLGKEAFDRFGRDKRSMSTLTLSISEKEYKAIEKEIETVRQRILIMARSCEKPDRVYQCNFNVFPLSRLPDEKEKS